MLNRREFLSTTAGGVVTLLLTPILSACGSTSSYGTSTTTNPTNPTCDGAGETSSITLGHSHTLCVPLSDLDNPPATGATYSTGVTNGHQHQVTLTQAQLMSVAHGQTVTVMTSTVESHTHDFPVQQAASAGAPGAPPSSPPVTGPGY